MAAHAIGTEPTGVEIPCSTLETHFGAEGRRLFANAETASFVTCSRLCLSARGRLMRYYYCCPGYNISIGSNTINSRILDAVTDRVTCIPSAKATEAPSAAPTASSKLEMRECPSRDEPQTLNDFVYSIQDDLCRYGCIYQEITDEQSGEIRNVTRIIYTCCPSHKTFAVGALYRRMYTCVSLEESTASSDSTSSPDASSEPTAPSTASPLPPVSINIESFLTKGTVEATTEAPTTSATPQASACPDSSVPQATNQFTYNSQTRLCGFPCSYEEVNDLGFDTVARQVTRTIYRCCAPYKAVAVGPASRPLYDCQ